MSDKPPTPRLTGTFVVTDCGFSKTVDEQYDLGDGVTMTRQVFMDYSYTDGDDCGKVVSATSFDEAVTKIRKLHEQASASATNEA
jgi:hypothetical protein